MLITRFTLQLLTVIAILIGCPSAWAATYYVNGSNGSDSNTGALNAPWKTIGKANSLLQAGDTVYIRQGTYTETIKPLRSGSEGRSITYAAYGNEQVTITGVYDGADLRGKSYIALDGLRMIDVSHYWVNMREVSGTHHNIIRNCYLKGTRSWAGIYMMAGADYNQILNNTLIATCDGSVGGPADTITIYGSSYNRIENNDFQYATHMAVNIESRGMPSKYNIIRNNRFFNPWHSAIGAVEAGVEHTLIEGNHIYDSGEESASNMCGSERDRTEFAREDHNAIQINSSRAIIRKNIMVNNGKTIFAAWSGDLCVDNRFYNNSSHKDYRGAWMADGSQGTIVKNNIFDNNILFAVKSISGNTTTNNNANNSSISGGTTSNNISVDPAFVSSANRNFQLRDDSPMIDAGAFLTSASSSGTGTSIPVQDATYFMDGWGLIQGDLIQLQGQSQTARIVRISSNTITVDKALSWSTGQGIGLPYEGRAPDLGSIEHGFIETANVDAPKNLRIISTN